MHHAHDDSHDRKSQGFESEVPIGKEETQQGNEIDQCHCGNDKFVGHRTCKKCAVANGRYETPLNPAGRRARPAPTHAIKRWHFAPNVQKGSAKSTGTVPVSRLTPWTAASGEDANASCSQSAAVVGNRPGRRAISSYGDNTKNNNCLRRQGGDAD